MVTIKAKFYQIWVFLGQQNWFLPFIWTKRVKNYTFLNTNDFYLIFMEIQDFLLLYSYTFT